MKKRFGKKTYTCRKTGKRAYHCTLSTKSKKRAGGKRKRPRTAAQRRARMEMSVRAALKRRDRHAGMFPGGPKLVGPGF